MIIYILTILGYLYYVQFSSTMGNIWIRDNHFVPKNAINLILYPLKDYKMWLYPSMWAINFFIWLFIALIIDNFNIIYLNLQCFYQTFVSF